MYYGSVKENYNVPDADDEMKLDYFHIERLKNRFRLAPTYTPYLEKHKICELFQEMILKMTVDLPDDHVIFMREFLDQAGLNRFVSKVFIYGPPYYDTIKFAEKLAAIMELRIIRRHEIVDDIHNRPIKNRTQFAEKLLEYLQQSDLLEKGWIFVDMPTTRSEVVEFLNVGIDPTHVLCLITCIQPPFKRLSYFDIPLDWLEYKHNMAGVKEYYKHCLQEINVGTRGFQKLAVDCAKIASVRKPSGAQTIPKICVIGQRGSGRKIQAHMLETRFNLVYLDFEMLFRKARIQPTRQGEKLREQKKTEEFPSDLLLTVLENRVMQDDCLTRGWVLTGFPNTLDELKRMDMMDTPPNRIVFLALPQEVSRSRLLDRRVNHVTGEIYHLMANPATGKEATQLMVHPSDRELYVNMEMSFYARDEAAMIEHCGCTAMVLDADDDPKEMFPFVEDMLIKAIPKCPHRVPVVAKESTSIDGAGWKRGTDLCLTAETSKITCSSTTDPSASIIQYSSWGSSADNSNDLVEPEQKAKLKSIDSVHNLLDTASISIVASPYRKPHESDVFVVTSKPEVELTIHDYSSALVNAVRDSASRQKRSGKSKGI